MERCKSCRTKVESETGICPVCGIDPLKKRKELSNQELKVRRAALNIHFVAMLHLIAAGIGIMQLPEAAKPISLAILSLISIGLAVALIQYAHWAGKAAVICYLALGISYMVRMDLAPLPVMLLALYVVGNKTARTIFKRQLPIGG